MDSFSGPCSYQIGDHVSKDWEPKDLWALSPVGRTALQSHMEMTALEEPLVVHDRNRHKNYKKSSSKV